MNFLKFTIPIILSVLIYGLVCESQTGEFFYNHNYQNTAFMVYKPDSITNSQWVVNEQWKYGSATDVIFTDIEKFVSKVGSNIGIFLYKDMTILIPIWIGIFVIIGILYFIYNSNKIEKKYIIFGITYYLTVIFSFYSERFTLPLLIFYFYLVARMVKGKALQYSVIILIALTLTTSAVYIVKDIKQNQPIEILQMRDSASHIDFTGKTIMARKPHIAYYLNAKFTPLQHSDTEEGMIKQLQEADYIYIGIIEMQTSKGKLKAIPQYAELVAYTDKSVLYKINKGGNYGQ